jgi:putative membrane protein
VSPPPSAPPVARTSPRVLLVHTVTFQQARRLVPVALAVIAGTGLDGGRWTVAALVAAVTLISLGGAAVAWWRFTYAVGDSAVVVTRGILSRSMRTVPLDRVRGVEIETPPLHRVFGLVRVRVDAAAGAVGSKDEELVIDGVSRSEGHRLGTVLLARRTLVLARGRHAHAQETRFDNRWLLYAPLAGSYLAVPLAALGALFRLVDELPARYVEDLATPDLQDPRIVVRLVVLVLLVLLVGSIVGSAVVNWRFRLVRTGGSLVAVRGLLTRRHTELELDRIRGCTVAAGPGLRWARAARVTGLVTGLGDAAKRGQLLPLGPLEQAWALVDRLVDDPGPLRVHPPAAQRRRVVRAVLPGVAVLAAGAVLTATQGWWVVLPAGAALVCLGVLLGRAQYAALGHAVGPHSLAVRAGWLVRVHIVLQRRAVVGWQVRQSFFQRRAGLATVLACVGAGSGGYAAVDLAAGEAAPFARAASGRWADALVART